jgi:DNA-binding helix-hairpin-helix protein with protein kinase domain
MPPSPLYDAHNRPLHLGREIARGGEGTVFEVVGQSDRVAKKYHQPTAEVGQKLKAMVGMAGPELLKVAAWPETTLHERPGGSVVGLLMRKVTGFREIHTLYSPASRRIHYPRADWKFLLMVGYNCAAAFDEMHQRGVVVGDERAGRCCRETDSRLDLFGSIRAGRLPLDERLNVPNQCLGLFGGQSGRHEPLPWTS